MQGRRNAHTIGEQRKEDEVAVHGGCQEVSDISTELESLNNTYQGPFLIHALR